jgi:hypothetical protein
VAGWNRAQEKGLGRGSRLENPHRFGWKVKSPLDEASVDGVCSLQQSGPGATAQIQLWVLQMLMRWLETEKKRQTKSK